MNFKEIFLSAFKYKPTNDQLTAIDMLTDFMLLKQHDIFILKGYAGTGKTTLISAFIQALDKINFRHVLLAPTGRAAKVLSLYSGKSAFTIHKRIYKMLSTDDGYGGFIVKDDINSDTVFIVDEASMISGGINNAAWDFFRTQNLLDDLFEYVFNGSNCKLILIGDTAQLPPVGLNISLALDISFIQSRFSMSSVSFEIKEVVRQSLSSQILQQATHIREVIASKEINLASFNFSEAIGKEVIRIKGNELQDAIYDSYSQYGMDETLVICRSNKRANLFNQQVRARILNFENEINAGDLLIIVRNNYLWISDKSQIPFIANGDIVEVMRVKKIKEIHDFRFVEIVVRFTDYPEMLPIEAILMLDVLNADGPSLSQEKNRLLFNSVLLDYADETSKRKRYQKLRTDPYLNALQAKFAFAVTCHKSQGGQWKSVFVEQGYLSEDTEPRDFLRWLYTAITRATEKVYLVNFEDKFFL